MIEKLNIQNKIEHITFMIQTREAHNPSEEIPYLNELLSLSEQINYAYGQALAHVKLASNYQTLQNDYAYAEHIDMAESIAKHNGYIEILIECFNLQGFAHRENCDQIAAISVYLKGAEAAQEIADQKSLAIFYNNIAVIFHEAHQYDDAEIYYLKAIEAIKQKTDMKSTIYRKTAYINLINVGCAKKALAKAKKYEAKCDEITCNAGTLPLIEQEEKILLLILAGKEEEAKQRCDDLITYLKTHEDDPNILQPIYIKLLKIALSLKHKQYAHWCLTMIDHLYHDLNPRVRIEVQELKIEYAHLVNEDDNQLYEQFYQITLANDHLNKTLTTQSFRSFIDLYKADKELKSLSVEQDYLQFVANKDELTKIYNRRYFNKLLSKHLQKGHTTAIAYVMIDVDYFKEYNDYYGHSQGDQTLITIANILQDNLPKQAYVARYGGDEFSCLLLNSSDEEVIHFMQNVHQKIADEKILHQKHHHEEYITLSIGAYNAHDVQNIKEATLIKCADEALYHAKQKGRNTFHLFTQ